MGVEMSEGMWAKVSLLEGELSEENLELDEKVYEGYRASSR